MRREKEDHEQEEDQEKAEESWVRGKKGGNRRERKKGKMHQEKERGVMT